MTTVSPTPSSTALKAAKVVDARGTACPGPLLEAKKGMGTVPVGPSSRSGRATRAPRTTSGPGRPRSATTSSAARRRRLRPRLRAPPEVESGRPDGRRAIRGRPRQEHRPMTTLVAGEASEQGPSSPGSSSSRPTTSRTRASTSPGARTWTTRRASSSSACPARAGSSPSWILHAIEPGFDGVFIASDGDECAYLPDCAPRTSRIMAEAQALLKEGGVDPQRVKMAAICSVCAEPFTDGTSAVRRQALAALGPVREARESTGLRRPRRRRRHRRDGVRLKLGDMGYQVSLVEKEASVGGKMILLSKVFPTLDCASCISTPKMAATIHHPNVTVLHLQRGRRITPGGDGRFTAPGHAEGALRGPDGVHRLPECETACTVAVPDQFNADLVATRAAHIAFPQAVPKKASSSAPAPRPARSPARPGSRRTATSRSSAAASTRRRSGWSSRRRRCVGTLGRACYAPVRGRVHARLARGHAPDPRPQALHRRTGTTRDRRRPRIGPPTPNGQAGRHRRLRPGRPHRRLAARPERLRASRSSRPAPRRAASCASAIPSYRLPARGRGAGHRERHRARRRDRHRTRRSRRRGARAQGFDAVLLATGTPQASTASTCPARSSAGRASTRLPARGRSSAEAVDLAGKRVVGDRRRERRHGYGADGPPARRRRGHGQPTAAAGRRCRPTTFEVQAALDEGVAFTTPARRPLRRRREEA